MFIKNKIIEYQIIKEVIKSKLIDMIKINNILKVQIVYSKFIDITLY